MNVIKANAKVNLSLDVTGKRADGYHLLSSVMQEIDLYDEVMITKNNTGHIQLTSNVLDLPTDEHNIAFKACRLMIDTYDLASGYEIHIKKNIPVAAGLAGGSTDGAAVLKAISTIEKLNISDEDLRNLSLKIGADLPFCLLGGTALAEGIGEVLTPLKAMGNYWLVLVKPNVLISTASVYSALNLDKVEQRPNNALLITSLLKGDVITATKCMHNVLEDVTARQVPEIGNIKRRLLQLGALYTQMSGSGPSVFGIFTTQDLAKHALEKIIEDYKQSYLVTPITRRK